MKALREYKGSKFTLLYKKYDNRNVSELIKS